MRVHYRQRRWEDEIVVLEMRKGDLSELLDAYRAFHDAAERAFAGERLQPARPTLTIIQPDPDDG